MSKFAAAAASGRWSGWLPTRAKAVRIALWYLSLSAIWIFCSGWVLHYFVRDPVLAARLENVKGWAFILVTAFLLRLALDRYFHKIRHYADQLQENEARLRLIGDNLPEGYVYQFTSNTEGTPQFTYVSAGVERVQGVTPEAVLRDAKLLLDQIDPAQVPAYRLGVANSERDLTTFDMELRMRLPDGQIRLIHVRSRPRRDANQRIVWDGFVADITARKQAEAALQENQRLLQTVINLVPHPIFAKDRDSRHVFVNEACAAMNGLTPRQMIGKSDRDFVPDAAQAEAFMRIDREVIEGGRRRFVPEERLTNAAGQTRILQTVKIPFELPGAGPALLGVAVDITDLKRAENALRESQSLLQEMERTAKVGGWDLDPVSGAGRWTDEVARIHDLDPSVRPGKEMGLDFYPGDARRQIEAALAAAIRDGTSYDLELEFISAKGVHKWVRTIAHPIVENGQVVRLTGSFQDITERQTQFQEIQRLNRLYATLSEVNQAIVRGGSQSELFADLCRIMIDFGKFQAIGISEWHPPAGGWTIAAQRSLPGFQDFPPAGGCGVVAEVARNEQRALCNDFDEDGRARCCRAAAAGVDVKSCAAFPLRLQGRFWGAVSVCSAEPGFFKSGEIRLLEEIAGDVSHALDQLHGEHQRREAQAAAEVYRTRLAAALASTTDAVFISDAQGRFLEFNEAFASFHKFKNKDECARTFDEYPDILEVFLADGRPAPVEQWAVPRALRGEIGTSVEYSLRRKDTGEAWVGSYSFAPIRGPHGEITGSIVVGRDITAWKQAEAELRELNHTLDQRVHERTAELRASNEELDAFAYAVSHDLRAPLRAMSGFSQALVEDFGPQLAPEAREFLHQIQLGSRQMGDLIDGLLRLSRVARSEFTYGTVDVSALANRLLDRLQAAEPHRRVQRTVAPGLRVHGDERLLEVAFGNLLGNAWKYTARTAEPAIRVEGGPDTGGPTICVADNGAGFDMKHAAKLFQPFQRLHREDEFPGLGIGLATVRRILRRHGGDITATATPGAGATFRLTLPAL